MEKKGEEWEEYNNAVQWMVMTFIITFLVTIVLAIISMPLGYLIGNGISKDSLSEVSKFIQTIINSPSYLFSRYWHWIKQISNYHGAFSFSLWLPILPIISLPFGLLIGAATNPYRFQSNIHGSARIAELKDIKKMGLLDGFCMVVGKYKGHLLMMKETLSTLCCAPPGTGKTLLARAVAGEAKVPFFSISGSEFIEMFVGMGAARVRDLFKQAQEKAPCIIFIDEIDAIGKKRDSGRFGGNDEREQTLNQLLSEMDGFDGSKGIVILAATNRPDSLDKALLRPGRFDRRIPVELPDLQGREAILRVHAKNIKTEPDIDYKAIARATSGASGAELANIVNEAALRAVRMNRDSVTQSDFEESVEVVIAGYQRKGAVIPKEQKRIVAYHEIGHALVAARQKNSAPVHKITIVPRTSGALGYTMQVSEDDNVLMSKEELFNKITTLTGGRSAEEVIFKSITTGASNDIEQATRIARAMVTRFGMTDEFDMMATETVTNAYLGGDTSLACSETTSGKIDAKVMEIIKDAHAKARAILENDIEKLHELSAYLLEKETITGEEFMYILEHGRPETKNETAGEVIDTTAAAAEESAEAKEPAAQAEETSTAE